MRKERIKATQIEATHLFDGAREWPRLRRQLKERRVQRDALGYEVHSPAAKRTCDWRRRIVRKTEGTPQATNRPRKPSAQYALRTGTEDVWCADIEANDVRESLRR